MIRLAALFASISGFLHLLLPIASGFAHGALFQLSFGSIWLLISFGLRRNLRWLTWLTFYFAMVDAIAALYAIASVTSGPDWLYSAIFLSDVFIAVMLFGVLWISQKKFG